jgi:putative DNA primase/helicase
VCSSDLIREVLAAIEKYWTFLPSSHQPPCWIKEGYDGLDPRDIAPCRNGLLHIPTRRLIASTPDFFVLNALDIDFIPKPPEPKNFLKFLNDLWPNDEDARRTIQEIFGYLLTGDTSLQKIFMLIGPRRSGKGTISHVIHNLLGRHNTSSPTLTKLTKNFGLADLIGKSAAIIPDARFSGKGENVAAVAERLLSISGGDLQTIERKYRVDWNGLLTTRFVIMSNELPKIEDASGTLTSRFIIIRMTESFYGREDKKLLGKLLPELPGILVWALDGHDRLRERGSFLQPESSSELLKEFEELSAGVGSFIDERCDVGLEFRISRGVLYSYWQQYCKDRGHTWQKTEEVFGRDLRAQLPKLGTVMVKNEDGKRERFHVGIRMKPEYDLKEGQNRRKY